MQVEYPPKSDNYYATSSTRHTLYVVARPVDRTRDFLSPVHKLMSRISGDVADIGALMGLSVAHLAIVVEGNYYHLKKMPDKSLALDLTPFSDDTVLWKLPASKTSLSGPERLGIAVTVISEMTNKRIAPQSVPVFMHGALIPQDGFDYSKYTPRYTERRPNAKTRGTYKPLFNNCIHFVQRLFEQLRPPKSIKGLWEELVITKEFMEEYLTKDHLVGAAKWFHDLRVGERVNHFLHVEIEPQ